MPIEYSIYKMIQSNKNIYENLLSLFQQFLFHCIPLIEYRTSVF